jgi:hypothetical protein
MKPRAFKDGHICLVKSPQNVFDTAMKPLSTKVARVALLIASVLFVRASACAQYITLTANTNIGKASSQTVNIASNELATVLHLSTKLGSSSGVTWWSSYLEVVCEGLTNNYYVEDIIVGHVPSSTSSFRSFYHSNLPIIAGPASLREWFQTAHKAPSFFAHCKSRNQAVVSLQSTPSLFLMTAAAQSPSSSNPARTWSTGLRQAPAPTEQLLPIAFSAFERRGDLTIV